MFFVHKMAVLTKASPLLHIHLIQQHSCLKAHGGNSLPTDLPGHKQRTIHPLLMKGSQQ